MIESVLYGSIGTLLTLTAIIYGYKTIQNFQDDKEVAIRMLILDEKAKKPFIYLSFVLITFAIISPIDALYANETTTTLRRIATILLFSGVTYFAYDIEHITRKHSKKR